MKALGQSDNMTNTAPEPPDEIWDIAVVSSVAIYTAHPLLSR